VIESAIPMGEDSILNIGSLSKPVLAVAAIWAL
jgi:CubicO group peptidase (beta-lactamase class C family)